MSSQPQLQQLGDQLKDKVNKNVYSRRINKSIGDISPVSNVILDDATFFVESDEEKCREEAKQVGKELEELLYNVKKACKECKDRDEECKSRCMEAKREFTRRASELVDKLVRRCGTFVCGTYDCTSKTITIYLKCVMLDPCPVKSILVRKLIETLAHELIHHAQYNNIKDINGVDIEVRVDCNQLNVLHSIPYRYRPHEVEAYEKQGRAANAIQADVYKTAEQIIDMLCKQYPVCL